MIEKGRMVSVRCGRLVRHFFDMKPNIPLIIACLIVFGMSAFAFAQAEQFAPLRTTPEKWGYGVGFTTLALLGSTALFAYLAGREDRDA